MKAWNELRGRLIEVADVLVFNENHGCRQGIEQNVQAVVGLNQVCAEVFYLSA